MSSHMQLLFFGSCATFAGFVMSTVVLMAAQRREKRFNTRLASMLTPHLRAEAPTNLQLRLGVRLPSGTLTQRLAAIAGYNAARKDHHPVAWYIVVAGGIFPAFLAERIASSYVGVLAWPVGAAAWVFACRLFFKTSDRRLANVLYKQFPDALSMIVRSVRVGIPVSEAVRIVGREAENPTAGEFVRVANEIAIGTPIDRSLRDLAERSGLPEYRFFATALALQSQTGGALSETLEGLADTIRKRVAAKSRGKALAAEARTSAMVLMGLPPVMGVLLYLVNPAYMGVLIFDPSGRRMLTLAAGLLTLGSYTMRQMIKKSLS